MSLSAQLRAMRSAYAEQPNEVTRYQVVRIETLIRQWAPESAIAS
ncbi:hypothetical protein [Cyanobium sp. WAJ14-Wanaka]|nr:hypothetical protein [Cyanobium sp. WAJ14-Wanaka]